MRISIEEGSMFRNLYIKSFKVVESIYCLRISKEEDLKLRTRSLYIKCSKFTESIYHMWITKEEGLMLRSL